MGNKQTPKVRFSGFNGEWEECAFGSMYDVVSGYAFEMSDYVDDGIPIINGESIQHGAISTKNLNFLPQEFLDQYQNVILETDDIVLGLNRPITNGKLKIAQVPLKLHDSLLYQRAGKVIILSNTNINFSYQLLDNEIPKFVFKEAVGSDQPFISTTKLKKWLICIPELEEEQVKIGTFFKRLDDTMAIQEQELVTLKQTKQGFLQNMFPKEGEPVPEVRFPGYTGDWEWRRFKDFISKTGKKNSSTVNYPAYSVSNKLGLVNQAEQFNESRLEHLDKKSYKLVEPNEFAYNPARINVGSIAFNNINETVIVSSLYVVLKMSDKLENEFILQFIKSPIFINEVRRNTEGSVRQYLFFGSFKNIKFPYTSNKEEQQKISDFFKKLDETIALHEQELDTLKQTKKAFLQKMFV